MIGSTVERSRIEQIFVDVKENSDTQDERLMGWQLAEFIDKLYRKKRVLVSSDFRSAMRKSSVLEIFKELALVRCIQDHQHATSFRKGLGKTLIDLQ